MAVIVMDFFRVVLRSLVRHAVRNLLAAFFISPLTPTTVPKINRKSYIRVAPWKRNVIKTLITKKPKDSHSRDVVEVREAIQKADSTIPSTQSPSQHFIRISSKKSCPVGGLCGEYASVVTEYSDPKVQEVAQVGENLELPDLQIKGTQLKLPLQRRKKVNHQPQVAKLPLPPPRAMNQTTTTAEHPAGSSMSFEVQMANSETKKPARKTKRRRKTREELEAKQAAAAQRRMVCHSTHLTTTVYILLSYSHHY